MGVIVDCCITYTVYIYNKAHLIRFEANQAVVEMVKTGTMNDKILTNILLFPIIYIVAYVMFKNEENEYRVWFLLVAILILIIKGTLHLRGGFSWWGQ